ncbi:MAG: hypothetical protein COA71_09480 [SAR86 cluster bacterium]|uniref:PilZ domain-containing protein n=1 Tax=SAR86 cluster bacterium TaxID=2030880 RepID=A0A2A5CAA3_9GAMM|nr:MAG: hypothetical protein COA71_09480 [SAR86 cluster bacterium]
MEHSTSSKVITNKKAILRYLSEVCEKKNYLNISLRDKSNPRVLRSSILKIEPQSNQLILRQLHSKDKPEFIQNKQEIEITCPMQQGTLKFRTQLSSLDDSENALYYQADIPDQIIKTQLRSSYRVSVMHYQSKASLEFEEGIELMGICRDISLGGVQCLLFTSNKIISHSQHIKRCNLNINELLSLSCSVKICHVQPTEKNKMLIGLSFIDLEPKQRRIIEPAMSKLERQNISNKMILSNADLHTSQSSMLVT